MPSPKDGSPGSLVPPAEPDDAHDADDADPGQVEQVKAGQQEKKTGKYGSQPVRAFVPVEAASEDEPPKSWIEIKLVDEDDKPVSGESYAVTLPDGSVKEGSLDEAGFAHVEGFDPGQCKVSFKNLDKEAWEKA